MSADSLLKTFSSERFKLWLSAFLATQLAVWIGYFAAWGNIPFLGNEAISSGIATFIASIVASAGASIFVIFMAKVDNLLNLLAETAERAANNPVDKIVMKTDAAAEAKPSELIVGPSDLSSPNTIRRI